MDNNIKKTIKLKNLIGKEEVFSGLNVIQTDDTEITIEIEDVTSLLLYVSELLFDGEINSCREEMIENKGLHKNRYNFILNYQHINLAGEDDCVKRYEEILEEKISKVKEYLDRLRIEKSVVECEHKSDEVIFRNIERRIRDFRYNDENYYKEYMYFFDTMIEKVKKELMKAENELARVKTRRRKNDN